MTELDEGGLLRPIIGIENRTAQEAFDIMADRLRAYLSRSTPPAEKTRRAIELWFFRDLTDEQRYKLGLLVGLPGEAWPSNQTHQRKFLDHIFSTLVPHQPSIPDSQSWLSVTGEGQEPVAWVGPDELAYLARNPMSTVTAWGAQRGRESSIPLYTAPLPSGER